MSAYVYAKRLRTSLQNSSATIFGRQIADQFRAGQISRGGHNRKVAKPTL